MAIGKRGTAGSDSRLESFKVRLADSLREGGNDIPHRCVQRYMDATRLVVAVAPLRRGFEGSGASDATTASCGKRYGT